MEITKVRVFPMEGKGQLKAFVSITLGNCFAVNGIRVVEGNKGVFVSMPNRKDTKNDKFLDIAHPINNDFREKMVKAILDEYNTVTAAE